MPEAELFIILSLYELKGIPILPIKKYLPIYYSKIEALFKKFENLKLSRINGKKGFDTKFYEHYLYLIKEKTEEHLDSLQYFYYKNYYLIIQRETNLKLNPNYENVEYIDLFILNLLENEDIKPFYKNDEFDEFFSHILIFYYACDLYKFESLKGTLEYKMKRKLNVNKKEEEKVEKEEEEDDEEQEEDDTLKINNYGTIIYSLANFNEASLYIIQNNSNFIEKYDWDDKTPLSIYMAYLKSIKIIYYYILRRKAYEYSISFLEEYNITEKTETRLNSMKNNIDLSKIIPEIIKTYEKLGINNNALFEQVEKWITNYIISKNEIMNEYNKISNGKMNIVSFFNFLEINCNIIIKAIETFNSINEILKFVNINDNYLYDYHIILNLNTDFIFSQDKNESRKILGDSLFKSGKDLVNHCIEYKEERIKDELKKKELVKESKNIKTIFEFNMKICFYFDEGTEKFHETCSNLDLIEFVKNKIITIKKFIQNILEKTIYNEKNDKDDLLFINNKLNEKNIYSLLTSFAFGFNFEIKDKIQKQKILNLYNQFLEENQNLISSYLQ